MGRIQPVMAVIEGYSEHVTDASWRDAVPGDKSSAPRWTPAGATAPHPSASSRSSSAST